MRLVFNAMTHDAKDSQINYWLNGGHAVIITKDRLNEYATHNYWKYNQHRSQFRIVADEEAV